MPHLLHESIKDAKVGVLMQWMLWREDSLIKEDVFICPFAVNVERSETVDCLNLPHCMNHCKKRFRKIWFSRIIDVFLHIA